MAQALARLTVAAALRRTPWGLGLRLLLLFALAFYWGCSPKHPPRPELLVLPGAQDLWRYDARDGTGQVNYRLAVAYPAEGATRAISAQLQSLGWQPGKGLFHYPDEPSSLVKGWSEGMDASSADGKEYLTRGWYAYWTNPTGDVVWYHLQYRRPWKPGRQPPESEGWDNLTVAARHLPARVAEAEREAAARPGEGQDTGESGP